MRFVPDPKYDGLPCSYVGTGCAYEAVTGKSFNSPIPDSLKSDGYMTLDGENKFIRSFLKIKKKQYFKRTERVSLKEFLEKNTERCCVCVYGHFIYVDGSDYWSFFDNDNDKVVCIWYIESGLHEVVH